MSEEQSECPICLLEILDSETEKRTNCCQKPFHQSCLDEWLSAHSTCPLCRQNPGQNKNQEPLSTTNHLGWAFELGLDISYESDNYFVNYQQRAQQRMLEWRLKNARHARRVYFISVFLWFLTVPFCYISILVWGIARFMVPLWIVCIWSAMTVTSIITSIIIFSGSIPSKAEYQRDYVDYYGKEPETFLQRWGLWD